MDARTLEQAVELRQIGEDVFENVHFPAWSWPGTSVFPGGSLMAQAAAAAYRTVSSDFSIDSLQAHFLAGPDPRSPLQYQVLRLSDGGRFSTRTILAKQEDKTMLHVICTFTRSSALTGPSMTHAVERQGSRTIEAITLDDLEPGRNEYGPYMKFQRLPLDYTGPDPISIKPSPASKLYTSVACISPHISSSDARIHSLGILALSDYHVLDAAPTLHGLTFGLPSINDLTQTPTPRSFRLQTSLNHNVHFAVHEGFRADDLCYIEVTSTWTGRRRGELQSRIFDRSGRLIATCVQEAYYVLKEEKDRSKM